MANNLSPEVLIPLVEQRSVIWDKTLPIYKDKGLKLAAWREICCVLDPNFDTWGKKENKDFATKVSTKWIHIRDAFMRSLKREKEENRSGADAKTARPYVYKNQLSFLLKGNETRMKQDSCNELNNCNSDTCSDAIIDPLPPAQKKTKPNTLDDKLSQFIDNTLHNQEHPHVSFIKGVCSDATKDSQLPPAQKQTKPATLGDKMSQFRDNTLHNQEHPHVSFIKGVLPSVALFDDKESLEFQMGVLELIQKIIKKRRENNLYGAHTHLSDYQNHMRTVYFSRNDNKDPRSRCNNFD